MKKVLEAKAALVYKMVASIPTGKVSTYGDIAALTGLSNPRNVVYLLHHNPDPDTIPCHRVVSSVGHCAKNFAFGFDAMQEKLLKAEGVTFINGHVDMTVHRWIPNS